MTKIEKPVDPIESVLVLPMGFTQSLDRDVGSIKLWRKLRPLVTDSTTLFHPWRWDTDMRERAEFIWNITREVRAPAVYVAAYSWGCGWTFIQLAKELLKRDIHIVCAVLCDPIYRSKYLAFQVRSMMNWLWPPSIRIPENVDEVFSFYQTQNKPRAHKLVADKPWIEGKGGTLIHPRIQLNATHQYMDDHWQFHQKVVEVFTKRLNNE